MTVPPIRPFGAEVVWAPTGSEAAAFDRQAIDRQGVPQATLMECAGRSAAHVLQRLFPHGEVVAFIGGGNNGGDGLVLLRTLSAWGRPVKAILVADRARDDPLLHGWEIPMLDDGGLEDDPAALDHVLAGAAVLVDGILGTGIRGAPRDRQTRAIRAVGRSRVPVFSLDVPSGIDADTGQACGESVNADVTVALGWPKLGTLLQTGRARVGRLIAVEIGFPPPADGSFGQTAVTPAWAGEHRPRRDPDAHKNRVGALLLVAGRSGMAGAAVMASRAALRAGLGLLRVVSAPENREIIQVAVPEAIFVASDDEAALRDAAAASQAVAAGPGLGSESEAAALLERVLSATVGLPTVLDADALNLAASGDGPDLVRWAEGRRVLVTPHLGEMRRLSDRSADAIERDRMGAARALADRVSVTVLLKGLPSIVVPPEGIGRVDTVATSDLATGGMGDVLAGVAGALLAQGAAPDVAGALALYLSGRAAVRAGKGPTLMPSDVIEELPGAWGEEGPGETDLELPFVIFDQDAAR